MNRLLRPLLAGGLIAAAVVPFVSACADNDSSLFIAAVMSRKPPTCTVTNDPTQPTLGGGLLDVNLSSGYEAALLVGNQLTPRGAKQELNTETTRVVLDRAEVSLKYSSGEPIDCGSQDCGNFSVFGTGYATSATGEDPGWGIFDATLIPPLVGEALRAQIGLTGGALGVVAVVKVSGQTLGGKRLESSSLSFPIAICNGCSTCKENTPDKFCGYGQDGPVCSLSSVAPDAGAP